MSINFRILTVCTGNICRSPLAEQLFRLEFQGDDHFELDSAGTQAMVGHSMPENSLRIARRIGVRDPDQHRAKQLTEPLIDNADLILAMDRGHRKQVVELSPRSTRKVFSVRDFARLVEVTMPVDLAAEVELAGETSKAKLNAAVEAARLGRSDLLPLESPADEDIVDPFGKSDQVYEDSAAQLIPAVRQIASYFKSTLEI
ncbi:low molecular weight phosphotyrosine protein phosp [Corynebacterium callunae]|uniref:Low molecular weight phosphotyrosine protein phosp n=1 Tax=Corynebacterium callunae DSM 20147 TaxID=1121353 RepID=M1URT0_9CORY|nr:low molecular weight phosphotyrosine protein phosp [Corynebacterium callunae]AGG65762.1 low molecular weight phosphotyrosine protein phosp [Corynebacterium callunae DSM 20147]